MEYGGFRAAVRATALLFSTLLPITAAPAQEELVGGYVVTVTELWRFGGGCETKIFECRARGSCVSKLRVEVHGETHEYFVFAKATATTATISFSGRDRAAPELTTASGHDVEVSRDSDGVGGKDVELIALNTSDRWHTAKPYTLREMLPSRMSLAKVRVTVRRENAAEQNR